MYVDIKQAFYRALRPLIAHTSISLERIAQLFSLNKWSPSSFKDFCEHLQAPDALQQARISSHMKAQVSSALTSTWFKLQNRPNSLTATDSGVKPGDSIADLLFGFLMTPFLGRLRAFFIQNELHTALDLRWIQQGYIHDGEIPSQQLVQGCWVDDVVLLLQDPKPCNLLSKLERAMVVTRAICLAD